MNGRRFTTILEFRGGTYLDQVHATDIAEALQTWLAGPWSSAIDDLDDAEREHMHAELVADDLIPVAGLAQVWCVTALVGDDLALVHIVG